MHDGVEIRELCEILKKYYGLVAAYCCDLVVKIRIELGMYSPDRRYLYFVKQIIDY